MKLLAVDVETTGVDVGTDRIVEVVLMAQPETPVYRSLVNPGRPIPAAATAVHGITDEDVQDAPIFADIADAVQSFMDGCVPLTYNGRSFDILILHRELQQAGQPGFDLEAMAEIDLYRVWMECEPRTLEGALERFCDIMVPLFKAHTAEGDARALFRLLDEMCLVYNIGLEEMVQVTRPTDEVDRSGKLRRLEDGTVVFAFGKHEGEPVTEHLDYVDWMRRQDFPADTLRKLAELTP